MATQMPPLLAQAATLYYTSQQQTARNTANSVQTIWRSMEGNNFTDKWNWYNAVAIPAISAVITNGQAESLETTMQYLALSAAIQGFEPEILLGLERFISNPELIASTITVPMTHYVSDTIKGKPENAAKAYSSYLLTSIAANAVQDAGRDAVSAMVLATPQYSGYIREVSTPACSRCIVLAGKWFKDYTPFDRHTNCDCLTIPSTEEYETTVDSYDAIEKGLVTGLSKADREAILEHGADVNQVINSKSGMYSGSILGQDVQMTYTGTTKRGLAGASLREFKKEARSKYMTSAPRLTVGQIMEYAKDDKAQAIRLLEKHAYVLG